MARSSPHLWRRALAWPLLFITWFATNHPWIVVFLVKPSDQFKHAHLVIILYNMLLAELCFFVIFFGYPASAGQAAVAVVLDEGIKWLMLLFYQALFRWAMAEPDILTLELQDDKGWHLVFRQTAPFVWPRGVHSLCEFDPLADNFAKLDAIESFRHRNRELIFMLRWPSGSGSRSSVWAQKSNPLTDTEVVGFRPIRLATRRSVPLRKSPDEERALIVGGHPKDGEGAYYAIGHRLLRAQPSSSRSAESDDDAARPSHASSVSSADADDDDDDGFRQRLQRWGRGLPLFRSARLQRWLTESTTFGRLVVRRDSSLCVPSAAPSAAALGGVAVVSASGGTEAGTEAGTKAGTEAVDDAAGDMAGDTADDECAIPMIRESKRGCFGLPPPPQRESTMLPEVALPRAPPSTLAVTSPPPSPGSASRPLKSVTFGLPDKAGAVGKGGGGRGGRSAGAPTTAAMLTASTLRRMASSHPSTSTLTPPPPPLAPGGTSSATVSSFSSFHSSGLPHAPSRPSASSRVWPIHAHSPPPLPAPRACAPVSLLRRCRPATRTPGLVANERPQRLLDGRGWPFGRRKGGVREGAWCALGGVRAAAVPRRRVKRHIDGQHVAR